MTVPAAGPKTKVASSTTRTPLRIIVGRLGTLPWEPPGRGPYVRRFTAVNAVCASMLGTRHALPAGTFLPPRETMGRRPLTLGLIILCATLAPAARAEH